MGLDIVEYVMAVEEAFEIVFDDYDLQRIRTVGEFHQLVIREIRTRHPRPDMERARRAVCVSSRGFYHLRKAVVECGFCGRKEITPKTSLESIIPRQNRRVLWDQLADATKCGLPSLARSKRLCWTLFAGSTAFALCPIGFGIIQSASAAAPWFICALAGFYTVSMVLSRPLAVEFRLQPQTVGNLVEWLVANNWTRFANPDREWTDREVWNTICRLLIEKQGINPAEIRPDATFVDNLRMD